MVEINLPRRSTRFCAFSECDRPRSGLSDAGGREEQESGEEEQTYRGGYSPVCHLSRPLGISPECRVLASGG